MSDVWTPQAQSADEWAQGLYSSLPYQMGGIPGNMSPQKLLSWYKSLEDATGLPFLELLGGTVGQTEVQPSLQKQAYGNNPIAMDMFAYMDAGDDPMTAFNKVKKNQEDSKKYGDGVDFGDQDTADKFFKIAEDYKFETAKNQTDAAGTYTTASGKKYQGSGDILSEKSQYDLMGKPSTDTLMKQVAASREKQRAARIKKNEAERGAAPSVGAKGLFNKAFNPVPSNSTGNKYLDQALRTAAGHRIDTLKNTMIQSDAQQEAVRKLAGLLPYLTSTGY